MNNHITVIDFTVGTNKDGFAVRVGPEVSPQLRLANCINPNGGLIKYASNGSYIAGQNIKTCDNFNDALKLAINYRDNNFSGYVVRADCTIA